jgi:ATP-dependent 26S proteasome regulatory subunit
VKREDEERRRRGFRQQMAHICETIELPLRDLQFYKILGMKPPRGIFLFGPPGRFLVRPIESNNNQ